MTVEEAKRLNKGDYVLYKNLKYKVLHTKEHRHASTNEPYIVVKCIRKNAITHLSNEFIEMCNIKK